MVGGPGFEFPAHGITFQWGNNWAACARPCLQAKFNVLTSNQGCQTEFMNQHKINRIMVK
jgi:hypothetical protein